MRDSATGGRRRAIADDTIAPGIMFKGKGRYLNSHKAIDDRRNKGVGQNQSPPKDEKLDPLTIMGCFNCDDPNKRLVSVHRQLI